MAKKFGKLAIFSALAGVAAAGTYYYLQNRQSKKVPEFDDYDDFDDCDYDFYDDADLDADEDTAASNSKSRPYVSLDLDSTKEIIGEKVIKTIDKTKEKLEHLDVAGKLDKAKEIIGEMTASSSSAASEPVYTEVDMSAADGSSLNTDSDDTDEPASSPASDIENDNQTENNSQTEDSEKFFDEADDDTKED